MTFKVIDRNTGKESTIRVIEIDNIAKKGGLIFVGKDGSFLLADACGKITYCNTERFEVIAEQEPKTNVLDKIRAEIEEHAYPVRYDYNSIEKGMTLTGINQIIDKYRHEG